MPHVRSLFLPLCLGILAVTTGVTSIGATAQSTEPNPTAPSALPLYTPPEDTAELLQLDAPMRTYFEQHVALDAPNRAELHELVDLILSPRGLGFIYDAGVTLDARETFRQRRGNCVSFSFLIVAVARHYGFRAVFQTVDVEPRWDRFGALVASIVHLNVRVSGDDGAFVVDLRPDLIPRIDPDFMHPIRDERAIAQFFSDIGFFRLVHDRPNEALHYLKRATEIDGRYADGWANLGTAYLHVNDLAGARSAFEHSLRADRGAISSLVGLVDVLTRLGTPADLREAAKYERRAERVREKNPYYQQHLADVASERADWTVAEKRLRRAISLKNDEPEFYRDLAVAQRHLGREDEAQRTDEKARKLLLHPPNPVMVYGSN